MKRFYLAGLVLIAAAAGFFGGKLREATEPEPVQAQNVRAKEGVRIALINLEKTARQSKWFKANKIEWDAAQDQLKQQNKKMELDYRERASAIQRAQIQNPDDPQLAARAELQALQEAMKAAEKEQQQYLGSLLAHYQKEVLQEVMTVLDKYVSKQGYDIVIQDYDDAATDADFFSGGAYAQSLMSKPVLVAPGIKEKRNQYVTDITAAIIALVE
jgi:Skp family chaperone for outer membrane proteins